MAFNNPLQGLRPDQVRYLAFPDNHAARRVYLDLLALLQDVLIRYSSSPVHPVFEDASIPEAMIDQTLRDLPQLTYVPTSLAHSAAVNTQEAETKEIRKGLIELARLNKETAVDLRGEYTSPTIRVGRDRVRQLIDDYLADLSAQVRILRYPSTQPLVQGHSSHTASP